MCRAVQWYMCLCMDVCACKRERQRASPQSSLRCVTTLLDRLLWLLRWCSADSRLQPPVLGFSGPPIVSKCICDVCQLKMWLALWQDDLFKSTFYLCHFVRRVCLIVCLSVCIWAHGTSKARSVKEHLLLYLPQGHGFLGRPNLLWMLTAISR